MKTVRTSIYATILCGLIALTPVNAKHIAKTALIQQVSLSTCDKQVVVLGELPTHGEAMGFQAKAEIVQYLIEQCGFTALFFEAPMYDFIGFQRAVTTENVKPEQLEDAIGGFWLTQELASWRQWLFEQSTAGHLTLAGIDDQVSISSKFAKTNLPHLLGSMVQSQNKCQLALERNMYWRYDTEHPYGQAETNLLYNCAQQAANKLQNTSHAAFSDKKMAENLANLYARNNKMESAFSRDEMMYKNFQWQYQSLAKDSKAIIWTATVHAARQQGELMRKPMGVWLAEQWQENMAVIGFTAYQGESSMAGMPIKDITAAPDNSLEAKVTTDTTEWVFLSANDLSKLGEVSSRLYGKFMTANWSSNFDAVMVIRQEKAPVFNKK